MFEEHGLFKAQRQSEEVKIWWRFESNVIIIKMVNDGVLKWYDYLERMGADEIRGRRGKPERC